MVLSELTLEVVLAGLAGGMIGAALGALPSLSLAGFAIVAGEALRQVGSGGGPGNAGTVGPFDVSAAPLDAVGLTGTVGFGPVLGPHVAFAGGVAAAAYVGRSQTFDTTFRYHQAKQITNSPGSDPRTLLVGGAFGVLGVLVARLAAGAGVPVDPVMLAVVVSAFTHRFALGYPLIGRVWGLDRSVIDMSPFERDERWGEAGNETSQGTAGRHLVEVWLPDFYRWESVATLGIAVGLASGYLALVTGSVFLAFGIAAASLVFLSLGNYSMPVTHHMALPASIAALAVDADPLIALAFAAVFGLLSGIIGELVQRILYAHADTHLDPPAVAIVVMSLLVTALATVGVFDANVVPYPVL